MLCIVVLALAFCRLLAHLLIEGQESKTGTFIFSDLNSNDKARTKIKTNNLFWRRQDKQKPVCVMVDKECGSHEAVLNSGHSYHKLNLL